VTSRLVLTRSGRLVLGAAAGLWVVAFVVAGTAVYLLAYGVVLFLGIACTQTGRRPRVDVVRVGVPARAPVGEVIDVRLDVSEGRGLARAVLRERVTGAPAVAVGEVRAGQAAYELVCDRRGVVEVGPLLVVAIDPLGLWRRETEIAPATQVLVHPRVTSITDRVVTRHLDDPPVRPPVSRRWPAGFELLGFREYVPGDDLRHVAWRATARTGRVMVREAEQGVADRTVIVLDTSADDAFELAVDVAAAIGMHHLRRGYEVTLLANGGPLTRPARGAAGQAPLLDALARVESGGEPLAPALTRLATRPRRDAHHVVITPSIGVTEAARLGLLGNRGVSAAVILVGTPDSGPAAATRARIGGAEEGADLVVAAGCPVVGVSSVAELSVALAGAVTAGGR
jgi:uncharacterized protein (DUF58 family)